MFVRCSLRVLAVIAAASLLTGPGSIDPARGQGTPGASKKPASSKPVKDRVKALETSAQECRSAESAFALYQAFYADERTTMEEKTQAQPRFDFWEQAAKDKQMRVGRKWMTAEAAADLKAQADKLVQDALNMVEVERYKEANTMLEKASKIYPEHLDSLFVLAYGAFFSDDVKGAEKRFAQVLERAPNSVPLLNNVAVCESQNKKFAQAVRHWEKASQIDPENGMVKQNLGKFIADAAQKRLGTVDKRSLDLATEIYGKMDRAVAANTGRGYVLSAALPSKSAGADAEGKSQIAGNGSGFVVAPGYILTNRHVVDGADALLIQDPANPDAQPLLAKLVSISREQDLAILECKELKAAPVPLKSAALPRGSEVLVLGYPITTVVGKGLKATRGIVTGLPDRDNPMLTLDAQVNPGNSGGPLCDRNGNVVGIVTAKTFTDRFVQGYGLAIPIALSTDFLKKHIPDFRSATSSADKPMEWTEVDAQISKSTVLILIQKKS